MAAVTSPNAIRRIERKRQAMALRKAGASYDQIGQQLGVSRQRAFQLVAEGLQRLVRETGIDAVAVRAGELERLDAVWLKLFALINVPDQQPAIMIQAAARLVSLSEHRCRLLNLHSLPAPAAPDPKAATAEQMKPILKSASLEDLQRLRKVLEELKAKQDTPAPAALPHPGVPELPAPPQPTTSSTDTPAPAPRPTPTPPSDPAPWSLSLDFVGGENVFDDLEDID